MGFNAFLDIAIGLVLLYLLLSLTCTVINEFISQILELRATTLAVGLEQLIDDDVVKGDFYNHGLIDGLMGGDRAWIPWCIDGIGRLIAYFRGKPRQAAGKHPSYLSGDTFARALIGSLDPTKPLPVFVDIESRIKLMPDSNIRDIVLAHVTGAEHDLEKLRGNLAGWFDHAMDRVGGVYQRKLRWISLGVGVALALALNADSIAVTLALWTDNTLRTQVADLAKTYVEAHPTPQTAQAEASASGAAQKTSGQLLQELKQHEDELRPFPIGWTEAAMMSLKPDTTGWAWWRWWMVKIAGLLITGLAISLGAPFWFDVLSKIIQVRATGDKPPRSKIEGDKAAA